MRAPKRIRCPERSDHQIHSLHVDEPSIPGKHALKLVVDVEDDDLFERIAEQYRKTLVTHACCDANRSAVSDLQKADGMIIALGVGSDDETRCRIKTLAGFRQRSYFLLDVERQP
ncbi:hypothetical protein WMF27_46375 [Sorangium sp. So ce281]|uniref:hypothetical protein n=1 Tax=unclassified Sorangium TaxID=2621164 RepID=UPI003F60AD40